MHGWMASICSTKPSSPSIYLGLTSSQDEELASLTSKLKEASEESQKAKKTCNQMEKEKADVELTLKSLKLRHEELTKEFGAIKEKMKIRHASSSSEHAAYMGECVVMDKLQVYSSTLD